MAHARQRSSGSVERPSLHDFPTDLSGSSKDDLLDLSHRFGVDITEVVLTRVASSGDHLVIESWHPDRGLQTRQRS